MLVLAGTPMRTKPKRLNRHLTRATELMPIGGAASLKRETNGSQTKLLSGLNFGSKAIGIIEYDQ